MIDDEYLCLFDRNRNLIPVLSLEGDAEYTDLRRGDGVYENVTGKMRKLHEFNILYGISITVTKRNIEKISDYDFISLLKSQGCRIVFFIEYVPVDETSGCLALDDKDRIYLQNKQDELRHEFSSVLFLSFPGDEDQMGGCLAAGRGFFHINPYGEAEACPFAPYSDMNLSQNTVLDVLSSDLFRQIKDNHFLEAEHEGGCTLFSQKDKILRLISHDTDDTDS